MPIQPASVKPAKIKPAGSLADEKAPGQPQDDLIQQLLSVFSAPAQISSGQGVSPFMALLIQALSQGRGQGGVPQPGSVDTGPIIGFLNSLKDQGAGQGGQK